MAGTNANKGIIIAFFIFLMISGIVIVDVSYLQESDDAHLVGQGTLSTGSLPIDKAVFERSNYAMDYSEVDESVAGRTMVSYYANRAYPGAPPTVPHPMADPLTIGSTTCLQCHENGGYVAKFEAFAPVTPHPEYLNCKQCHAASLGDRSFKGSDFEKMPAPGLQNKALVSSPPMIPHSLQLRANCLACHAGPAAPKEIRVTHPERVNCLQCHTKTGGDLAESSFTRSSF